MPLIATEGESKPKQLPPAGTHAARCISVVDIGTQTLDYLGKQKQLRKVRITWETPDERAIFNEADGEQPFLLTKEYTLSLFDKANLRHDLESWRGKAFTEEELRGFDIFTLIGVPCLITVIHKASADGKKTYANVNSISKLAKGMAVVEAINPMVQYSITDGQNAVFQNFPEWLRKKILESKEANEPDNATPEREIFPDGSDDEIPF